MKGFTKLTEGERRELCCLIRAAYHCEDKGDLVARNAVARAIFKNQSWRKVRLTEKSGVETRWDRTSKNWITFCVDSDGDQVNASYTGEKGSAAIAHLSALNSIVKEELPHADKQW